MKLCLTFGLLLAVTSAAGESKGPKLEHDSGIPPGSYQKSCKGCKLEDGGEKVFCTQCPRNDGTKTKTKSVSVDKCGTFTNDDGELACERPANAKNTPKGIYKQACGGCSMDGTLLKCTHCDGADGKPVESVLDTNRRCRDIVNVQGTLYCVESDQNEL